MGRRKGSRNKKRLSAWDRFERAERLLYRPDGFVDPRTKWKRDQRAREAWGAAIDMAEEYLAAHPGEDTPETQRAKRILENWEPPE